MTLFAAEGLSKRFGSRDVVSGVNLHVEAGEVVGLLGPNGAGKSTTFKMVVGLLKADAGSIRFLGQDITPLPMFARCRRGMGYLAQEPTIFASLTVADNVLIVLEQHYPKAEHETRLANLLKELNLSHLRDSLARSLSGGERRRLEITRALVVEPKLVFFDEPFAGVDPKSRGDIASIVRDLKSRGVSVLITDHHAEAILSMVDRCYVIDKGSILDHGSSQQIIDSSKVRRAYLGEDFSL